jgi:hypothetical protein
MGERLAAMEIKLQNVTDSNQAECLRKMARREALFAFKKGVSPSLRMVLEAANPGKLEEAIPIVSVAAANRVEEEKVQQTQR